MSTKPNRAQRRAYRGPQTSTDKAPIFAALRKRIAEALQAPGLKVRAATDLEAAISTFAPSTVVIGFQISDYPFPECRYVSAKDGHVYSVARASDDGKQLIAYRMQFIRSAFTSKGGIGVSITADGWMSHSMIMYSLSHQRFEMEKGIIVGLDAKKMTRQSYPAKKLRIYLEYLRRHTIRWPIVQNIAAVLTRVKSA